MLSQSTNKINVSQNEDSLNLYHTAQNVAIKKFKIPLWKHQSCFKFRFGYKHWRIHLTGDNDEWFVYANAIISTMAANLIWAVFG